MIKVFGNERVCDRLKALGADKISDYLELSPCSYGKPQIYPAFVIYSSSCFTVASMTSRQPCRIFFSS